MDRHACGPLTDGRKDDLVDGTGRPSDCGTLDIVYSRWIRTLDIALVTAGPEARASRLTVRGP